MDLHLPLPLPALPLSRMSVEATLHAAGYVPDWEDAYVRVHEPVEDMERKGPGLPWRKVSFAATEGETDQTAQLNAPMLLHPKEADPPSSAVMSRGGIVHPPEPTSPSINANEFTNSWELQAQNDLEKRRLLEAKINRMRHSLNTLSDSIESASDRLLDRASESTWKRRVLQDKLSESRILSDSASESVHQLLNNDKLLFAVKMSPSSSGDRGKDGDVISGEEDRSSANPASVREGQGTTTVTVSPSTYRKSTSATASSPSSPLPWLGMKHNVERASGDGSAIISVDGNQDDEKEKEEEEEKDLPALSRLAPAPIHSSSSHQPPPVGIFSPTWREAPAPSEPLRSPKPPRKVHRS